MVWITARTPQFCPATKSSMPGSVDALIGIAPSSRDPAPGLERHRRQRRSRQPVSVVADHRAEPVVLGVPLLGVGSDLLAGPADEVPPHDEPLLERLAAEQQQPAGVGG